MTEDDLKEPAPKKSEPPSTEAKKPIATADASKSKASEGAAPATKTAAPLKKKASTVVEEEDEDDDDEWEDEEDDEEEDEPPPPPKKPAKTAAKKAARPGRVAHYVERPPAKSFVPYAVLGMIVIAIGIVYKDWDYHPVAVLGIAIVVWSYIGIGSANEIKTS